MTCSQVSVQHAGVETHLKEKQNFLSEDQRWSRCFVFNSVIILCPTVVSYCQLFQWMPFTKLNDYDKSKHCYGHICFCTLYARMRSLRLWFLTSRENWSVVKVTTLYLICQTVFSSYLLFYEVIRLPWPTTFYGSHLAWFIMLMLWKYGNQIKLWCVKFGINFILFPHLPYQSSIDLAF